GTLEQFVSTIHPDAHFEFMGQGPYRALVLLQDFFTLAVLLAVLYACYRRYVVRPEGLGKSRDAGIILALTGSLMVSILLMNGFLILGMQPWFQGAMPISSRVAGALSVLGLSAETNQALSLAFKWVHMLIVLGFAMY